MSSSDERKFDIYYKRTEIIERTVRVQYDGKQFLVRIPAEISRYFNLKRGDRMKFTVKIPPLESHDEAVSCSFKIERDEDAKIAKG